MKKNETRGPLLQRITRRMRLAFLLTLVMGWASLLHAMEQSGTLGNFVYVETLVEMESR